MSTRLLKLVAAVWILSLLATLGETQTSAQELDWVREHGLIELATIQAAAFADDGGTVVAGHTYSTLPGQSRQGGFDAFVRSFDPDGAERWTRQFGSTGDDVATAIEFGPEGTVYVTGVVSNGALPGQAASGYTDSFIRVYDADGVELWTRQFGSSSEVMARDVAVDAAGNAYIVGHVFDTLAPPDHIGGMDAFIRSFSAEGGERWDRRLGTEMDDAAMGVAVSTDGRVYVVVETFGVVPEIPNFATYETYIHAFNTSGTALWEGRFITNLGTSPAGVAVHDSGLVFIVGNTVLSHPDDPEWMQTDVLVRAYDSSGVVAWERQFGTPANDYATGVRVDGDGHVRVEGRTEALLPGTGARAGEEAFVRTFDSEGNVLWTDQFDVDAPMPPSWVLATGHPGYILIQWEQNLTPGWTGLDLVDYHVFRSLSETGPFTQITTEVTENPYWIDTDVLPDTRYVYQVVAVDARGFRSNPSREVSVMWVDRNTTADFESTWERTDRPITTGAVDRTWMWGPGPFTPVLIEGYGDAPGGFRHVQYFDKNRMEDNAYRAESPWAVTNGRLVAEMVHGYVQLSDEEYAYIGFAKVNIAGDPGSGPTYADMRRVLYAEPRDPGEPIAERLHTGGGVRYNEGLVSLGVVAAHFVPESNHTIAAPFWEFMNSSGTVYQEGELVEDTLFLNPFYATGYPITEAYWTRVNVAGTPQDVLIQAFERRILTFTPTNPEGWKVEAGNVGQHYYRWRYEHQTREPAPTANTVSR